MTVEQFLASDTLRQRAALESFIERAIAMLDMMDSTSEDIELDEDFEPDMGRHERLGQWDSAPNWSDNFDH